MAKKKQALRSPRPTRKRRWRYALGGFILLVLVVLIAGRLYLPIWLKDYVNRELNEIPGYRGSISGLDVHLYRGAYAVHGLKLNKLDAGIPVPFLAMDTADFSLQWGALFDGRIVSDVHLYGPTINFAKGKSGTVQTGKETNWNEPIKALMPIDINVVEIQRGTITYQDFGSNPPVDIFIKNLHGTVNDLRNTEDKDVALPSTMDIRGDSLGGGKLAITGRLNVLTPEVDMDLDTKLEGTDLTAFNSFSNAYGAINFKEGQLDVYSELAVKGGRVDGYVKPIVRNLSVDRVPEGTNPVQVIWSTMATFLLEIFSNQPNDQFATKVPLSGTLDNVQTAFWPTLGGIIRNAFVEALQKGTDGDIEFNGGNGARPAKSTPAAATSTDAKPEALNPEERRTGR